MSVQPVPQPDRQELNAMDRAMVALDRVLRAMGSPGNETQALVWLTGRVDRARLQAAVSGLSRHWPVVAARLVEPAEDHPYWQLRAGAECELREIHLPSSDPHRVWDFAGEVLSTRCDPTESDPLRFCLVHLSDGRDVVLMQYNHALLDNNAIALLLAELDRLSHAAENSNPGRILGQRDLLAQYLERYPYERQMQAARHAYELRDSFMHSRRLLLSQAEAPRGQPLQLRIAARWLDTPQAQQLQARVVQACGFPSLSLGLLASALRILARFAKDLPGDIPPAERELVTDLGVDLGLRKAGGSLFQTLASMVPLGVPATELQDWTALVRLISRQLRHRLAEEADLGLIQLVSLSGGQRRLMRWYRRSIESGLSLWYAYFGSLGTLGSQWCGAQIETVCSAATTCPPFGATLLGNPCGGRIHLQLTYVAEIISDALANDFLDQVMGDLVGAISIDAE